MSAFENIIPGAFLICVALTACGERTEREGYAQTQTTTSAPAAGADTVGQPGNMPAPQPAPEASRDLQGKDSAATAPLAPMTDKKENNAMPEALHGNNHSSPNVGSSPKPDSSPLKKSSLNAPKSPKIIWV